MLSEGQLSDLESAARNLSDKQLILNTAIDIQMLLQIMVDKSIISREEVQQKRSVVRNAPKYRNAQLYIDQTAEEIKRFQKDPQERLREMFRRKMENK